MSAFSDLISRLRRFTLAAFATWPATASAQAPIIIGPGTPVAPATAFIGPLRVIATGADGVALVCDFGAGTVYQIRRGDRSATVEARVGHGPTNFRDAASCGASRSFPPGRPARVWIGEDRSPAIVTLPTGAGAGSREEWQLPASHLAVAWRAAARSVDGTVIWVPVPPPDVDGRPSWQHLAIWVTHTRDTHAVVTGTIEHGAERRIRIDPAGMHVDLPSPFQVADTAIIADGSSVIFILRGGSAPLGQPATLAVQFAYGNGAGFARHVFIPLPAQPFDSTLIPRVRRDLAAGVARRWPTARRSQIDSVLRQALPATDSVPLFTEAVSTSNSVLWIRRFGPADLPVEWNRAVIYRRDVTRMLLPAGCRVGDEFRSHALWLICTDHGHPVVRLTTVPVN